MDIAREQSEKQIEQRLSPCICDYASTWSVTHIYIHTLWSMFGKHDESKEGEIANLKNT